MHDPAMADLFMSLLGTLRSVFRTRAELALENLALRQQLANLRHMSGRPRIRMADRAFWLVLSRMWSRWADVLVIVKPDTVVRWHLDNVIVLGERHLYRILNSYFAYYHRSRTHLSLGKDPPEPRPVQPPTRGKVVALPEVGGLHHRYERLAA